MLDRLALAGIPHRPRLEPVSQLPVQAAPRRDPADRPQPQGDRGGNFRSGYHDFSRNPLLACGFLALQTVDSRSTS